MLSLIKSDPGVDGATGMSSIIAGLLDLILSRYIGPREVNLG